MVGHVAPQAASGGPIAMLRDGNRITIDLAARRLDGALAPAVLRARRRAWAAPARGANGVMAKYAATVGSASDGAVTVAPAP